MKSYYELLKSNVIDFDKLIIDKYHLLGLDEANTIILIKLNNLLKSGNSTLSLNKVASGVSISIEELSERVLKLVNDGFVTMKIDSKGKETFDIDQTLKRLSIIVNDEDYKKEHDERNNDIKYIVTVLEREFKKILSPIEREVVNKWVYEYKYPLTQIEYAINDALKYKNRGINYIDKVLYRKNHEEEKEEHQNSDIQNLFKKVVYDKKK